MSESELPEEVWPPRSPVEVSIFPNEVDGRLKGEFTVTAHNRADHAVDAYICARGEGLRCEMGPTPLHLPAGGNGWVKLAVRSVDRQLFGDPVARPFEISCVTADGLRGPSADWGRFVQRALVPIWLVAALAALGLTLGLVLAFALPDRTTVPSVTGARSAIEAEAILLEAGLELGSRFGQSPNDLPAGTVLAQVPVAGTEVDEGSAVSVVVAVPTTDAASDPAATQGAVVSVESAALIALLPASFRERCAPIANAPAGTNASVYCADSTGLELFVYRFDSTTDLESAYEARVAAARATRDQGECGVDPVAEGAYTGPDGAARGRVLCTADAEGAPLVIWTIDERLMQIEARWLRSPSELAAWWRDVGITVTWTSVTVGPSEPAAGESQPEATAPQEPTSGQDGTSTAPADPSDPAAGAEAPPAAPAPPPGPTPAAPPPAGSEAIVPSGPNGETAQEFLERTFNDRDPSVVGLLDDGYVEHNPNLTDGAAGVLGLVSELSGASGDLIQIHRMAESDDLVAVHSSYRLNTEYEPEDSPGSVGADIFRFGADGQIIEHWSVIEIAVPAEITASGRSMVDGGGNPNASSDVGTNVTVVQRLYSEVFATGDTTPLSDLLAADYVDHDPLATSGDDRLREFASEGPMTVDVVRLVAQGDLVFVHAHYLDGPLGDAAVVDIFRLENGLIAEQWGVDQATVPAEQTVSGNDMFSQLS